MFIDPSTTLQIQGVLMQMPWLMPAMVVLMALSVARAGVKAPPHQPRWVFFAISVLLLPVATLFSNQLWTSWAVLIAAGLAFSSHAFTYQSWTWRSVFLVPSLLLCLVGLLGLPSGYSLAISSGSSMWPSSPKGMSINLLNAHAYEHHRPTYGDDVQIEVNNWAPSKWPTGHFRKRVVGLPGDEVNIGPLGISINGKPIADCSSRTRRIQAGQWWCDVRFPNGVRQTIVWGQSNVFYHSRPLYRIGEDELLVMGDNTVESADSREFGLIKTSWVQGRFGSRSSS